MSENPYSPFKIETKFKGIILAGGSGTRLYPMTKAASKQLLPVYNKPMIYYPLSVLMLAGIRDVLIITTPEDSASFQRLLGDGSQFGISITYAVQPSPDGLAQAFIIGEEFIGNSPVSLILGDNLFFGHGLARYLLSACSKLSGATVFGYQVRDPERYGVLGFDKNLRPTEIIEKPVNPPSNYAVTGLYFYDNKVIDYAKSLKPSVRGELEITDLNRIYLNNNDLYVELLGRGFAWLDTGTFDSYLQASIFVQTVEERQGLMISCPEEIAYNMGFIDAAQLEAQANLMKKNSYGQYLLTLLKG